jgi:hypothetical protein
MSPHHGGNLLDGLEPRADRPGVPLLVPGLASLGRGLVPQAAERFLDGPSARGLERGLSQGEEVVEGFLRDSLGGRKSSLPTEVVSGRLDWVSRSGKALAAVCSNRVDRREVALQAETLRQGVRQMTRGIAVMTEEEGPPRATCLDGDALGRSESSWELARWEREVLP